MTDSEPGRPVVVVVDDDDAVVSSLRFALETEGVAVRGYGSAAALLKEVDPVCTACVVIDYRLADLDGLQLLGKLREQGVTAPAIVITSHPGADLVRRVESAGALLIEKPLLDRALTEAIHASVLVWRPARAPV